MSSVDDGSRGGTREVTASRSGTDSPAVGGLLAQELRTVLRRERTTVVLAASLVATTVAVLGGRRLAQGALNGVDAVAVVVDAMAAVLPALALVATGRRVASRRSRGVELVAYLSGVTSRRQSVTAAADAIVLAAGALLSVVLGVMASGGGLRQLASHATLSAAVGVVAVVLVTAFWATALALLTDSVSAFILLAVLTLLAGVGLSWAGVVYPALLQVASAWPTQAVTAFLVRRTGQSYGTQLVAVSLWTVAATLVVRAAVPRAAVGLRPGHADSASAVVADGPVDRAVGVVNRLVGSSTALRVPDRRRRATSVAVVAAVALAWGVLLPAALASYVPWRLQPWWRGQVRHHVTSYDVARQFVAATQRGDVDAAASLAEQAPATVIGPLGRQVAALEAASAQVDATAGRPGVVVLHDGAEHGQLWMCLSGGLERSQGWLVQAVRTRPDCPAAQR